MACRPIGRNLGNSPADSDYNAVALDPSLPPLLAVRVGGRDHALEQGRSYLVGSDPACDLQLHALAVRPTHARLRVHGSGVALEPVADAVVFVNGIAGVATLLRIGDNVRLGAGAETELRIVRDLGSAEIVPDPALRAARDGAQMHGAAAAVWIEAGPPPARSTAADDTFTAVMARELRRAPWLGLSLLVHALILLLLLRLFPPLRGGDKGPTRFGFAGALIEAAAPGAPPGQPAVVPESSDLVEPELVEVEQPPTEEPEAIPAPPDAGHTPDPAEMMRHIGGLEPILSRRKDRGGGDPIELGGGTDSAGFRKAVRELRRTGLEVVFVFDSTGSMGRSIQATKANIASMLELLRALVPDAQFGLVTYRDAGQREDYVVRELPLGHDFLAAINFMQTVEADGGGNIPEAVLAGLRCAFEQDFARGSRRVVVLAGDAPPHPEEQAEVLDRVQQFARGGKSFVHTLLTSRRDGPDATTARVFEQIARKGNGIAAPVEDHDRILQQVLTFAFGAEFEGDLAAVQAQLAAARRAPTTAALFAARRGGPELERELRADPVPEPIVHALLWRLRQSVALQLIDLLTRKDLSAASRQAIAYVLQQKLQLERPPVDPEQPRSLDHAAAERLRAAARRLAD